MALNPPKIIAKVQLNLVIMDILVRAKLFTNAKETGYLLTTVSLKVTLLSAEKVQNLPSLLLSPKFDCT